MCEYCENFKPLLENENSVVFIASGRLILQDKTKPKFKSFTINKESDQEVVCYDSKWITMKSCPMCGK